MRLRILLMESYLPRTVRKRNYRKISRIYVSEFLQRAVVFEKIPPVLKVVAYGGENTEAMKFQYSSGSYSSLLWKEFSQNGGRPFDEMIKSAFEAAPSGAVSIQN